MIRHLKVARDSAVNGRTQAMQGIRALIIGTPSAFREELDRMRGKKMLLIALTAPMDRIREAAGWPTCVTSNESRRFRQARRASAERCCHVV